MGTILRIQECKNGPDPLAQSVSFWQDEKTLTVKSVIQSCEDIKRIMCFNLKPLGNINA
jgi:hypothetical protein